jgi:fimbrial chaperone protein
MSPQRVSLTVCLLAAVLGPAAVHADGFAALVSPARFELNSAAGSTLRQVFELTNKSEAPGKFRIRTADFSLAADYGVNFQEDLQPGSCRPLVALERPEAVLPPGGTMRYRFEVQVPADAAAGECRFAVMIEGDEPAVASAGAVRLPIVGRIAVIVYVTVGDAAPQIEVFGPTVVMHNGQQVPALRVHNAGNAHTRMSGFLTGKDATGAKYDFTPSDLPILPGEVREVVLTPSSADNQSPTLTFPVSVHGKLEWANQSTPLDESFK